ncbi:MAG: sulfatase-like hydrolase/transferase [Verrucomicrobia bacterium]|nr:sulfatase-like hydrolase/transferase [Verrucomicrobiota bacterium]
MKTPHLDALSAESLVFERAYCSAPLCVPTRVSMYTGQWPHRNGVLVNGGSFVRFAIMRARRGCRVRRVHHCVR